MAMKISTLQEQVEQLFSNIESLRAHIDPQSVGSMSTPFETHDYRRSMSVAQNSILPPSPAHHPSKSPSRHPRFHGPTSSAFNLGVAKTSLHKMGITAPGEVEEDEAITRDVTPNNSPHPPIPMLVKPALHGEKDPIWSLTKHEAIRLIHVWQEEMGLMYPFMDIDQVLGYAGMLFTFVEAAAKSGLMQGARPGSDAIMDVRTSNLKIMLAIALVLEGNGKDALGERLFENVHQVVEKTLSSPVDLQGINMLILTVRVRVGYLPNC